MSDRTDSARDRARGFTLLEVLAALTVFLVGVVGILGLFATGLAIHRDATERQIRAQVTEEVRVRIEDRLRDAPNGEPDLSAVKDAPVEGRPNVFYSVRFAIDPEAPPDAARNGVLATVEVYTKDAAKKHGETFTVFARPNADPSALIRSVKAGASGLSGGGSLVLPGANQKTDKPGAPPAKK